MASDAWKCGLHALEVEELPGGLGRVIHRHKRKPTIVLEAVASHDFVDLALLLWIARVFQSYHCVASISSFCSGS